MCDNWVVLRIAREDDVVFYKLLRGFSGGCLQGNSWELNSGVVSVEEKPGSYKFEGFSGSNYEVSKNNYGVRMNIAHVIASLKEKYPDAITVMPEKTNWKNLIIIRNKEKTWQVFV